MSSLRRVEGVRAGPDALGILVPPGRRTYLILRPRALAWDLVLLRQSEGATFWDMSPLEAETAALRLHRALEAWGRGTEGRVEPLANPDEPGWQVRVHVGSFTLLTCPRVPGEPYRSEAFADRPAATAAAERLLSILHPPPGVEQEYYVNTRHFGR
jgi:hypothetical protein